MRPAPSRTGHWNSEAGAPGLEPKRLLPCNCKTLQKTIGNPRFSGGLTAAHRVLYDPTTGDLFYDADGSGALAATRFANIGTGHGMTGSAFWVIA